MLCHSRSAHHCGPQPTHQHTTADRGPLTQHTTADRGPWIAHVKSLPPATAVASDNPRTATAARLSSMRPSPSWPANPEPGASGTGSHEGVRGQGPLTLGSAHVIREDAAASGHGRRRVARPSGAMLCCDCGAVAAANGARPGPSLCCLCANCETATRGAGPRALPGCPQQCFRRS